MNLRGRCFVTKPLLVTAPTSYWYLRWFPIDQMVQYTDWINLMTYDLYDDWTPYERHDNFTEIFHADTEAGTLLKTTLAHLCIRIQI